VRRLSGGGAVYHDLGNLNFTIIESNSNIHKNDFSFFALPVISCLSKLEVKSTFSGRNDILIDAKKFSGNA
jgi:lipoate---protein ligase